MAFGDSKSIHFGKKNGVKLEAAIRMSPFLLSVVSRFVLWTFLADPILIVDYLAIASRDLIGDPKFPTLSIYTLQETGHYEQQKFQGEQPLKSLTFPELVITPNQIFLGI